MAKITKDERDEEIQDKVERGNILCRATIQIMGQPKEHVEKAMDMTMDGLKKHPDIKLLEEKKFKPEKLENDMWNTFTEVEIMCPKMSDLTGFCFDFMPASIEVVEPEHLKFVNNEISELLNDLNAKLHTLEMGARKFNVEKNVALAKMNSVIRYGILRNLEKKEQTAKELKVELGIDEKGTEEFLDSLIKRGEVAKKGKKYKSTGKIKTME